MDFGNTASQALTRELFEAAMNGRLDIHDRDAKRESERFQNAARFMERVSEVRPDLCEPLAISWNINGAFIVPERVRDELKKAGLVE